MVARRGRLKDMKLEAAALSNIGLVRKSNQDSVGCYSDLGLFLLADGMGGLADGEIASRLAVDVVYDRIRANDAGGGADADGTALLGAAIEEANRRILCEGERRKEPTGTQPAIGATIVALWLSSSGRAAWAHVGDSRLYRLREDKLTLLTADHTVPGARYRDQLSVPLDLPHTNVLIHALGVGPDVEPSLRSEELRAGDLYLLCSDGVSGPISPAALEQELGYGRGTVEEKASNLIQLALDGSGRDNASVVLVRVLAA